MFSLENKLKKVLVLKEIKDSRIGIVYLYGSFAEGKATAFSDIDIGIVFTTNAILKNSSELYNKFFRLFSKTINLPYELDITFLENTTVELQYETISKGKTIYMVSEEFKADYEQNVINNYLDFAYMRETFDKALVKRIKYGETSY